MSAANKICSKCHLEKGINCFRTQANGKFGVRASCIQCEQEYRASRRDVVKQTNAAYASRMRKPTLREQIEMLKIENARLSSELYDGVEPEDDDEFVITAINEGSGNWAGKAKIISLRAKNGDEFDATFKGNMADATTFLKEAKVWIGREVTVKYNGFTGLGTPQFAQVDYNNITKGDR